MSIGIIIPTYNEKENLPLLVDRLRALPLEELHILVIAVSYTHLTLPTNREV